MQQCEDFRAKTASGLPNRPRFKLQYSSRVDRQPSMFLPDTDQAPLIVNILDSQRKFALFNNRIEENNTQVFYEDNQYYFNRIFSDSMHKFPSLLSERQLDQNQSKKGNEQQSQTTRDYQSMVEVRFKSDYEKIEEIKLKFRGAELWKALLRIKAGFTEFCQYIITSSQFETFIILVILLNTIALALEDPKADEQDYALEYMDSMFLYIYTVECLLKIGGMGFVLKPGSYLRDNWNKMDFIIVVTGWIQYIFGNAIRLAALRTLRILRPLRSISSIQGLKILFLALVHSFKTLISTVAMLLFFFFIFAIAGLQLWMGILKNRCMEIDTGIVTDQICGYETCPIGYECVKGLENPFYGNVSFDNILFAFLSVFQSVTLEGWTHTMVAVQKAFSPFVIFYFIPLVFIGAFFLLNITLAVVKSSFTKIMNQFRAHLEIQDESDSDSIDESSFLSPQYSDNDDLKIDEISDEEESLIGEQVERAGSTIAPDYTISLMQDTHSVLQPSPNRKITRTFSSALLQPDSGVPRIFDLDSPVNDAYQNNLTEGRWSESPGLFSNMQRQLMRTFTSSRLQRKLSKMYSQKFEEHKAIIKIENQMNYNSKDDVLVNDRMEQEENDTETPDYIQRFNHICLKLSNKEAFNQFRIDAKQFVQNNQEQYYSLYDIGIDESQYDRVIQILQDDNFRIWAPKLRGIWQKYTYFILILVEHKYFNHFMTLCVLINTVILALDHYGIEEDFEEVLTTMNLVFTIIFIIEMGLKLIGLGLIGYCQDMMNYLDGTVVILSLIELIFLSGSNSAISAFRTIRIFRTFRVMRVARLFRYMSQMAMIMAVISKSLSKFVYLALLLLLFILIFALIGMQMFGGSFDFEEGRPRANFDSFNLSFVTVFQILSMENWQIVLYSGMRGAGPFSCIYFITWIFLGNFVLLNLFLAILLDSFSDEEGDNDEMQELMYDKQDYSTEDFTKLAVQTRIAQIKSLNEKKRSKKEEELQYLLNQLPDESDDSVNLEKLQQIQEATGYITSYEKLHSKKSLFIFSKENKFRQLCYNVSNSDTFENIILCLIVFGSFKLVIDTYYVKHGAEKDYELASDIIDYFFTFAFTIECFIKSISLGFVMAQNSYLRDSWNQLDFFIVFFSIIEISVTGLDLSIIKIFRLLRTLRPLRFISHNISMKLVVNALLESIVAIMNVGIVLIIVWLMFAILGVSLYGGKFYSCEQETLKNRLDCEKYGFEWKNADSNFDNVLEAMMTLFVVSSLEGWPDIMYQAIDAKDIDEAPQEDYAPYHAYYFIVFVLIGSFFFLNLFVGVIFEKFNEAKTNESSISALILNKAQLSWVEMQLLIVKAKPLLEIQERPKNAIRRFLYDFTRSSYFEYFIMICIACNMLQMAIAYDEASENYFFALEVINFVFTGIFIIECILKLVGLGPKQYFSSKWNKFDFFVVIASIIDFVMQYFLNSAINFLRIGPQLARIIRVFRVSRLFRIVKSLKKIQDLVNILIFSLPAVMNVLSLLLLIYFIYSILGVYLYNGIDQGDAIDNYNNFHNFHQAMIILFRTSTGEEWNLIMYDCVKEGGYIVSAFYFVSFITITSFIMLNMFIMVILQYYEQYENESNSTLRQFNSQIKIFRSSWNKFASAYGKFRMHYKHLVDFMYELGENLGVPKSQDHNTVTKLLFILDIKIDDNGYVYYNDVLFSIFKRKFANRLLSNRQYVEKKILYKEEVHTLSRLEKLRRKIQKDYYNTTSHARMQSNFFFTIMQARTVFRSWKNWASRHKNNSEISITPPDSLADYPCSVSPLSTITDRYQLDRPNPQVTRSTTSTNNVRLVGDIDSIDN